MVTAPGFVLGGRIPELRYFGGSFNLRKCNSHCGDRRRLIQVRMSQSGSTSSGTDGRGNFDAAKFDEERLRLDAEARAHVAAVAIMEQEESSRPGAWKWAIRKSIWDIMETRNIAQEPRPVHHRIPNFRGAADAASRLARLPEFQAAQCVKVNPDTPQKQVRFLTLSGGKTLLTPQPRLRTGFFSTLRAADLPPEVPVIEACTSAGAAKYGTPIGLDAPLKVDLIVIGSVAVDPSTGARLGKGEGFAELEYGMLRYMGAIDDSTLVVTSDFAGKHKSQCNSHTHTAGRCYGSPSHRRSIPCFLGAIAPCTLLIHFISVHDVQVLEDGSIPSEKLLIHDVPVDVICTPTRTIFTNTTIPKPKGIYWEVLSPQKLEKIRILQVLKNMIEEKTGQKLPSGPDEKLPPTAARKSSWKGKRGGSSSNTRR